MKNNNYYIPFVVLLILSFEASARGGSAGASGGFWLIFWVIIFIAWIISELKK